MFHFDKNFGIFVGKLNANASHKHFALQISVSVNSNMRLTIKDNKEICSNSFILNSNIEHKLISESTQLSILINPLSTIGHYLYLKYSNDGMIKFKGELPEQLVEFIKSYECHEITFEKLCDLVSQVLVSYSSKCESELYLGDDRVVKAINYMAVNYEKVLSAEEVAEHCFLSPSRFLHLFKEKTNINFRRYQLWNKTVKSLPFLRINTIIDTAHHFGFTDSAHYSHTIKGMFGVTPKFLVQKK